MLTLAPRGFDLLTIDGLLVNFGVRVVKGALPYVAVCGTVALALLAYRAQKRLWKSDMQAKAASVAGEERPVVRGYFCNQNRRSGV